VLAKPKLEKGLKFVQKELDLFWFWIEERHQIYLNRLAKKPWPWTRNKILQTFKFTNPYRQNDKVTQEWTLRYQRILALKKRTALPIEDIFFRLCVFRFFNWPETYDALYFELGTDWNLKRAIKVLAKRKAEHEQLFTGAYIITGGGKDAPKHETICHALDYAYERRSRLVKKIMRYNTMEKATEVIQTIPTQGPFTAYEIACDLRHTKILFNAKDVFTWANPGPGAKRGIHRLLWGSKDIPDGEKKPDYNEVMRVLLRRAKKELKPHVFECEWPFEMREIEHSGCEFDKMRRVMLGEGRPRSLYHYKDPELFKPWQPGDDDEWR
jgi:alpha-glutamyl/putrescinyl thymine pyrophosphorylase clade 1